MKRVFSLLIVVLLAASCNKKSVSKLNTDEEKASYAIGLSIGNNFASQKMNDINLDIVMQAIRTKMEGKDGLMPDDSIETAIQKYMEAHQEKLKAENKKEGEEFLAKNKTKEGVMTTASGLQYKVIKEGTGDKPKPEDVVKVSYVGKTIDGKEFDSSKKGGVENPITFNLGQVIPGWSEGIQLMSKGAKYELYIPSDLAYGENGAGGVILPNSVLIFEVELVDINPPAPAQPQMPQGGPQEMPQGQPEMQGK